MEIAERIEGSKGKRAVRDAVVVVCLVPADGMGAVGFAGDVDRHFPRQFGVALMLGMLDALPAAVQTAGAGASGAYTMVLARRNANSRRWSRASSLCERRLIAAARLSLRIRP